MTMINMDNYAKKGNFYVSFAPVHLAPLSENIEDYLVQFRAALTDFKDAISPSWDTKTVYGRMDPIATYQRTERKIDFSIDILAQDMEEAKANLKKIRKLQSYMYPIYETSTSDGFEVLSASPLMRIGFANWTPRSTNESSSETTVPAATPGGSTNVTTNYLLGYIDGSIDFAPDLKTPTFESFEDSNSKTAALLPSKMSLSISFKVLHEEKVGWTTGDDGKFSWRS